MQSQPSKEYISDHIIMARAHVATEIMAGIIASTKATLEKSFNKPTSYYDGEKKNVLMIAKTVFECCVSSEDIDRIANNSVIPEIIDASEANKPCDIDNGKSAVSDSDCLTGEGVCF